MKSYEERLPLIDAAIKSLGGEWPKDSVAGEDVLHQFSSGRYISGICESTTAKVICASDEFNQRKAELAAKEQNMNDWYERGELPPVGSVVSFHRSDKYKDSIFTEQWCEGDHLEVLAHKKGEAEDVAVVWNQRLNTACGIVLGCLKPIRTERDALVEKAEMDIHQNHSDMVSRHHIRTLIDAGWRPFKQQTEDEFTAQGQELTDYVSTYQLSKLYRAGCRFIEQVKV